ncbi:MAG: hypothetical protein IJP17_02615, partial [Clostridia bacterium]|nr:hypothetical protein [Clostridia bacterium]
MKRAFKRIAAILLSVMLMLTTLTGCTEYLIYDDYYGDEYYGDYYDSLFDDYGSFTDQYAYENDGYADGSGSEQVVLNSNILSTAIREQFTDIEGGGRDEVTIMMYMCASDLESDGGFATSDLKEMAKATASSKVNIVIETGGCSRWMTSGISSSVNQRHILQDGRLTTIEDDLGRRYMTAPETLTDFITYSAENFPADRYMLILWDHGAGSVEGWGYDEHNAMDTLTI